MLKLTIGHVEPSRLLSVALVLSAIPIAAVSFRFVEQPLRIRLSGRGVMSVAPHGAPWDHQPAVTRAARVDVLVKPAPDEALAVLASMGDA